MFIVDFGCLVRGLKYWKNLRGSVMDNLVKSYEVVFEDETIIFSDIYSLKSLFSVLHGKYGNPEDQDIWSNLIFAIDDNKFMFKDPKSLWIKLFNRFSDKKLISIEEI